MFDEIKVDIFKLCDLKDQNTTLVIDCDTLIFNAAVVAQETSIEVRHKATYPKTKDVKIFKNRTEFRGRTNSIGAGSYLDDLNTKRRIKGKREFQEDEFEIIDTQTKRLSLDKAKELLDLSIEKIKSHIGLHNAILLVGEGDNFRHSLQMPLQYKSSRLEVMQPLYRKALKEYIKDKDNVIVCKGIEADDYLSIYGYEGYLHYKKTGKFNYIVSGTDKDAFQTPSLYFYYQKKNSSFTQNEPFLIDDGLGDLDMIKGQVKGYGFKWLMAQTIMGDWGTDCFSPIKHFNICFSDKDTYKLLEPCKTKKECLKAVTDQYNNWFPSGVRFTNFDGEEVSMTPIEWANHIFLCAYMKRSFDDKTDFLSLCKEYL